MSLIYTETSHLSNPSSPSSSNNSKSGLTNPVFYLEFYSCVLDVKEFDSSTTLILRP